MSIISTSAFTEVISNIIWIIFTTTIYNNISGIYCVQIGFVPIAYTQANTDSNTHSQNIGCIFILMQHHHKEVTWANKHEYSGKLSAVYFHHSSWTDFLLHCTMVVFRVTWLRSSDWVFWALFKTRALRIHSGIVANREWIKQHKRSKVLINCNCPLVWGQHGDIYIFVTRCSVPISRPRITFRGGQYDR